MKLDWVWLAFAAGIAVIGVAMWNGRQQTTVLVDEETGERVVIEKRAKNCRSLKGELDARVGACLGELSGLPLSKKARREIDDLVKGGRGLITVGDFADYPGKGLAGHDDVLSALLSKDEDKAAKVLRGQEFKTVVVARDLVGAVDHDNVVLALLAHHSHTSRFKLRYVTQNAFVYTVRETDMGLKEETGDLLLRGLRARLAGTPVPKQAWKPDAIRLIGTMRTQGRRLGMRHVVGTNIESTLDDLADKLRTRWERDVETDGHGRLEDRLDDIRFEVHVVMERAPVEPRDRQSIFELFEMGIDGAIFQHKEGVKDRKFSYMPGSELVTNSYRDVDRMLREMVQEFGWRDRRPWEDKSTELDLIRTVHFMEREPGGGTGAVELYRGMPIVEMESLTDAKIRAMLVNGGEWWLTNQLSDNMFEYKYWPTQNRRSDDYNEVRHILGTRDLADVWRYRQDERYLKGSRRSMEWLMRYAIYGDDAADTTVDLPHPGAGSMLFRYPSNAEFKARKTKKQPNQKLGTVAVAILGWIAYADASGDHSYDADIRKMAKYVASQQTDEGKFIAYNVPRTHSYYGNKNDIVPGEAALALGMVGEYFNEPEWLDFFPKFLDFYTPWFRERAVRQNPFGRWPHDTYSNMDRLDLVQFGPWSVMASKQYYRLRGDTEQGVRAASFGLEVADWMIDNYQWSGARSPWPDYVGGYYKMPTELPAMQTFCYSEGTAAAYTIASRFQPENRKYELSTREAIRFLDVMQFDAWDSYFLARPRKAFGGVKYTMNENKIRTDYVGHGLSTLSQYLDGREYDPSVKLEVPDPTVLDPVQRVPGNPEAGFVTDLVQP
ncbi:MAG: hypothetical protein H6736_03430 [Alphaproteobacteria bacterium]|nr:hypothetical protein [Alphaproteobacteria bacterium]MCB9690847.1 hypothetical protein [Alphaproteobacteria bacterium]